MKKGRVNTKYEEKYIKSNRTFPLGNTVLLVFLIALQIGLVFWARHYEPQPQDVIRSYRVSVVPLEDGTLDIEYYLRWEALDQTEDLTWVEIGMANDNFTVYPDSLSDNIASYGTYSEDGDVTLQLDLDRAYHGGEIIEFTFRVNQRDMLCQDGDGYFFEFVPGWFNAIRVQKYEFRWLAYGSWRTWRGSLDYGEYHLLKLHYPADAFTGCETVKYRPFNGSGAFNQLERDREDAIVLMVIGFLVIIVAEVYILDCYVSYHRGRGFMRGHGYHIHTYGRTNPWYIQARDKYNATHRGSGGGRGCACACACACAGGGRAGCSQKDTFGNPEE